VELENKNLETNLESARLKLKSQQSQLEILKERLSYFTLTAPCDGIITSQNVLPGDTVSQGNVISVISDMSNLQFEVNIDELDIGSIKVGQEVSITADALPETSEKPLQGKVKKISLEGVTSNGVTVYPVIISVDNAGGLLRTGMNVNGKIMISSRNNVLTVPLEAISKDENGKTYVYVKTDMEDMKGSGRPEKVSGNGAVINEADNKTGNEPNTNAKGANTGKTGNAAGTKTTRLVNGNNYYAGSERTEVVTGVNDDTNIEIISGLKAGQVVVLPPVSAKSSGIWDTSARRNVGIPPGGAMPPGGGMPGGGMPGGGGMGGR